MRTNDFDFGTRANEHSAASACSTDITFEAVQKAMDACRKLRPTNVPDVYVMTTAAFRLIRDEVCKDASPATKFDPLAMFGIPIEHYVTLREVHERCLELRDSGKRVALVCQ